MKEKRLEERGRIFGDCGELVWEHKSSKGYTPIPRILPLIIRLLTNADSKAKGNPGKVYLDLWLRSFDSGFLKIDDESSAAYSAGYDGERGLRTWREHMKFLETQGFILIEKNGLKDYGYVLLINPLLVVADKIKKKNLTDTSWINAFSARCTEIGVVVPQQLKEAFETRHAKSKTKA